MSNDGDTGAEQNHEPTRLPGQGEVPPPPYPPPPPPYGYASEGEAVSFGTGAAIGGAEFASTTLPDGTVLPATEQPMPPARRSRKRWAIAGSAVVVLALVGGGAAFAYSFLSGGGAQPDTVVPANAVAYASVDLDPSAGQKIAAARFLRKFPDLKNQVTENGDLLQELVTSATKGDPTAKINYARDLKSWIGKRAAVAVLPPASSGGSPREFFVIQVTDEATARTSIHKLLTEDALGLDDSESSCTASSDDPTALCSESVPGDTGSASSLAGTSGASGTDDAAPTTGVVVRDGYALIGLDQAGIEKVSAEAAAAPLSKSPTFTSDMKRITAPGVASAWVDLGAVNTLVRQQLQQTDASAAAALPATVSTGRLVAGIHIDPGYVELQAHTIGSTTQASTGSPGGPLLQTLPANTTGALAVGDVAPAIKQAATSLDASGLPIKEFESATGIKFPDDLETLLGSRFVVAVGDVHDGATPQIGVRVTTDDPSGSSAVLDRLEYAAESQESDLSIPTISHATASDGIAYGSTQEYASALAANGTLGADPDFQKALPAVADADIAGYLSFDRLATAIGDPDTTKDLAPLAAYGFTVTTSGTTADFDARLVAH